MGAFNRSLSTPPCSVDLKLSHAWPFNAYHAESHAASTTQHSKKHLVSFRDAWLIRISITTQYNSTYVIIEQLVTLAQQLVRASYSWACIASSPGSKRDHSLLAVIALAQLSSKSTR